MSRCIDGQIGNLLAAYEADMLDDADREKFELHALECRYCNEQIRKFSRGARLMRFDPRVRETIAALDSSPARKKRPTQRIGQAILVAAAVLAFLILKPWQLEFSPTDQAVAAGSRLTVMYFENLADPADTARLGQIATHLLIADLSESQYIDVVSSQRLFDVLKLLGSEDVKSVDRAVATQVAVRADARWMLLGSILQVEPRLELATQLVEVSSGDVIESQRITGSDGEDIFALVDRLSVQVRNDLTLPSEAFQEPDRLVADVTTHSREAYRHYLEGLDNYYKLYIPEAVAGFEKAIEEDSTFAMAYYYLSRLKSRRYVSKAIKYSAAASQKEQAYISVLKASAERDIDRVVAELRQIVERYPDEKEALLQLGRYLASRGRYEEAIGYLDKAVEIDPLYKLSHDLLALCYSGQGDFENAILAIDRYIELAPDEANPYDTRADIYARSGRLDEAIRSMWEAVRIKRDFANYRALLTLGQMYVFRSSYDTAGAIFQELASGESKAARSRARTSMALIPLHQGRLDDALKILDDGITADRLEQATSGSGGDRAFKHFQKAYIALEKNDRVAALDQMRKAVEIHNQAYPGNWHAYRYLLAQILAEAGEYEEAEQVAETLKVKLEANNRGIADYRYAMGCIRLAQGNIDEAVNYLRLCAEESDSFFAPYMLGRVLLEAGLAADATTAFETALGNFVGMRKSFMIWSTKSHYYLGVAYEQTEQWRKAAEQYDTFLSIWANASPIPPEIEDARIRLTRLRARP